MSFAYLLQWLAAAWLLEIFHYVAVLAEFHTMIVGGSPTTIDKVPYIVYVRRNGIFICGGTLVAPRFVVSAAHCFYQYSPIQFDVTAGATLRSVGGVRRAVDRIAYSPIYDDLTMHMDVAVVRLVSGIVTAKNVQPLAFCSQPVPVGALCKVSGWGYLSENGETSDSVRTVEVPKISQANCESAYKNKANITNTMFCAGLPGVKDACNSDSGGPLVYNNELCGIVSAGIGCAQVDYPGVYTNVSVVLSFILSSIESLT